MTLQGIILLFKLTGTATVLPSDSQSVQYKIMYKVIVYSANGKWLQWLSNNYVSCNFDVFEQKLRP